ncbi:MAG: hypothetical protein AAF214_09750, partial [Pseudomonadota bacterium]
MPQTVRSATLQDIPSLIPLLLADAEERRVTDPILWNVAHDAAQQVEKALIYALSAEPQPFRQIWQVAQEAGRVVGVIHSMLLPVPPIYAGAKGDPGLILPDACVAPDAPEGTVDALVAACERALMAAGAQIILSSYVTGPAWQETFVRRGYDPLTLYLSRSPLDALDMPMAVRPAAQGDVAGIVRRSAEHRQILFGIDPFWAIHPDSDARFAAWMSRSLTLGDRDMLVMGSS